MSELITPSDLWTITKSIFDCMSSDCSTEKFLEFYLDQIGNLIGADRKVLFMLQRRGEWKSLAHRVRNETLGDKKVTNHIADLLKNALSTKEVTVSPGRGRRRGGSIAILPLRQSKRTQARTVSVVGALYLEIPGRTSKQLDASHIEFIKTTASLVTTTLIHQAQLDVAQENLRATRAVESMDSGPSLEEVLSMEGLAGTRAEIEAAIVGESSLMILGESGTGKTHLATEIAKASGRLPIVRATLGASEDLNTITSELFGHERGAFSGAVARRKGLVEYADGGTLILDEILNLPFNAQQLLLDFTQFGTYRPLGYQGMEPKHSKVRIISATNGNVGEAIKHFRFRKDLYYRLCEMVIKLPPLREHRDEITTIAERYLRRIDVVRPWRLSANARRTLLQPGWGWEGNIRELQSVIQGARDRALASGLDDWIIEKKHISVPHYLERSGMPSVSDSFVPPMHEYEVGEGSKNIVEGWGELQDQRKNLDDLEREIIDCSMIKNRGVITHAARELNISRTTLISRMATLKIDKNLYRK